MSRARTCTLWAYFPDARLRNQKMWGIMKQEGYEIADRVQYVGAVKAGYPLPGGIGTVVEITDEGDAVVRFGRERLTVRNNDQHFKRFALE